MKKRNQQGVVSLVKKILRIFMIIVALTFQVLFYFFLIYGLPKINVIAFLIEIMSLIIVIIIYRSSANSAYKQSWIIMIMFLPPAGLLLYLIFGQGRALPRRKYIKITKYLKSKIPESVDFSLILNPTNRRLARLLYTDTKFPLYKNTASLYYSDGRKLFENLINDLSLAKEFIFMEYYIIADGQLWRRIKEILISKALSGVEVKIIYDEIGSKAVLSQSDINELNNYERIMMVAYNPMGFNMSLALNYRDHRKLTIIDGKKVFVGGVNIADEYVHLINRFGYWRDNGMLIEGDAVYSYTLLFSQNWYMSTKEVINPEKYRAASQTITSQGYVFPFGDGPTSKENVAYNLMISMFNNAERYIYISTPYFIIDRDFLGFIAKAARSGVDVRILLPKIPDKQLVFLMSRSHYGDILEAGGKIYEYDLGFNHAKNIICDDSYALLGTINIDYRSLFLHFECGNLLLETASIIPMREDFLTAVNSSTPIDFTNWKKRPLYTKGIEFVLSILAPLM